MEVDVTACLDIRTRFNYLYTYDCFNVSQKILEPLSKCDRNAAVAYTSSRGCFEVCSTYRGAGDDTTIVSSAATHRTTTGAYKWCCNNGVDCWQQLERSGEGERWAVARLEGVGDVSGK